MKLTVKQANFAQCIADGMTQADAYRSSFNVRPGTKPESVYDSATKLMKNPMVTQRVHELRAKLEKKGLWSREMSIKALVKAYQVAEGKNNAMGMTSAIREMNAMHGFNAPQKVDLTGGLAVASVDATKLSTEVLKQLMAARDASR